MRQIESNAYRLSPVSGRDQVSERAAQHISASRNIPVAFGRSLFPADAVARIYRPVRSVKTSGRARTRDWVLLFDRRSAPYIEPLMGWTGGDDTLDQVKLTFPSREAAVAYAQRQGLNYVVEDRDAVAAPRPSAALKAAAQMNDTSNDVVTPNPAFAELQAQHRRSGATKIPDLERALVNPASVFRSPNEVVENPDLPMARKREILRRWAWDGYLLQLASDEAMPEGRETPRLDEVKRAQLALEVSERSVSHTLPGTPREMQRAA